VSLYNLKDSTVLKKHQIGGIDYGLSHHYCIIADQMGLGKTLEALAISAKTGLRTLVVCPAYLKETWMSEVQKFTNLKAEIVNQPQEFKSEEGTEILIASYSQLKHIRHLFMWARMIISDECHYLKSLEAKRTEMFHEYVDGSSPERLLLLSGTPIKNRVGEYFSLLILASYNPRGTSGLSIFDRFSNYYQFMNTFSSPTIVRLPGRKKITKYEGVCNAPLLREYLKGKFIRRLSKDVLDLPDTISKDVYISYDHDPKLEELWEYFLDNPTSSHVSTRKADSAYAKSIFTCQYVDNLMETEDSCVIFTDHLRSACHIKEHFGGDAELIIGSVPPHKRHKIVEDFQAGKFKILVATIRSANTGFTLTRTNNIVFNDISFVGSDNEQAKKRIDRIGQERKCVYHFILGSREDKMISKAVEKKDNDLKVIYNEE